MLNFYVDDSYIRSSKEDKQPRINALGGILIDEDEEAKLIDIIKDVKKQYTHENMPIKWNFKDTAVVDVFDEFDRVKEHEKMKRNSRDIRLEIIRRSLDLDFMIVISCIEAYSKDKKDIRNLKNDFSVYLFENLLYRLGHEAKLKKGKYQIIMDWPTDSDPSPYNRAYYYLYNSAKTLSGNKNYCGPLKEQNFRHSLLFTKCTHSPCLQYTDFVVGAFKDYMEFKLHGREKTCMGEEVFEMLKPKFRANKGKILGYGIIPSNSNKEFRSKLESFLS